MATPATTSPQVTHHTSVLLTLLAGVIFVVLADWIPHLVNGVLILILVGTIVTNQAKWTPWVTATSQAFSNTGG